jgi:hypothetical protein
LRQWKRPRSWPNNSLSSNLSGNGGAVEFDQCPIFAPATVVESTSNQFFSRAGLSQQQYSWIAHRHGFDQLKHLPQSRALPYDSFKVCLAANLSFKVELLLRESVLQLCDFTIG